MAVSTILALTGNIQTALPGHTKSPFAWLEAIAPPLLVLSTAYVLKEQVLETVEQRHADERAFQATLADWRVATADPEQHMNRPQSYANALRDALLKADVRCRETLSNMSVSDWRAAVYRETQADLRYEEPESGEEMPVNALDIPADLNRHNENSILPKVSAAIGSGAV
jgi:hypothetical protein